MNTPNSGLQRGLLVLALALGILGDALLRSGPWGLNLALWASAGIGGVALLAHRENRRLPAATWIWFAGAWICAALLAGRAAEILVGLTLIGGVGCLIFGAWAARGGNPLAGAATEHVFQAAATGLESLLGGFAWLLTAVTRGTPRTEVRPPSAALPFARALVGLLVAVPVLVLFGALFASADPVFAKGLRAVIDLDYQVLLTHAFAIGFWAWICAGYGRRLLVTSGEREAALLRLVPASPARAPGTEVLTGLGLLAALFLAFVGVQLRYLFGDDALVQATVDMTYAEYARRGFFELLAVAFLLLPLLLGCDWLVGSARNRKGFQALAGLLLALLAAILVSAAKRLGLYTAAYGLTEQRLYAAGILVWLALVTLWFGLTVLPGLRHRFVGGTALAALLVLVGLHVLNPDAFIARHNLARARAGLRVDVQHFLRLGPDATPVILRDLSVLPEPDRKTVREAFERRWRTPPPDWRTWNLARRSARRAVAAEPALPAAPAATPTSAPRSAPAGVPPAGGATR